MINLLPGIHGTAAALDAERIRMEVITQNIANANTTRGLDGKPYQRQVAVFETVLDATRSADPLSQSIQVARITKDNRQPRQIMNPGHPDADKNGVVLMPNIDVHVEMVDYISASRAFEANLAVAKHSRNLAMQALSIGKR